MEMFLCGADIWSGASQVQEDSYRPHHNFHDRNCPTGHGYAHTKEGRTYRNNEEKHAYQQSATYGHEQPSRFQAHREPRLRIIL
jgi:hypothetical protein